MIFDPNSSILVIFCRRPTLGIGKRRIAATLGNENAYIASQLLLETTLEDAASWPDQVVISPSNAADTDWATDLLPEATVLPQPEGSLGERLQAIDTELRAAGGKRILFVGSDAPGLNPATLIIAAAQLEHEDAVIIPAADGGVTLLGAGQPWPELASLPWETPLLCAALVEACAQAGMSVAQLSPGYDVDDQHGMRLALRDLADDERDSRQRLCAWIRATLPTEDRISAVIPVLNDPDSLRALLDQLSTMEGVNEIIVVDGGQSASTRELCTEMRARYLQTAPNRGQQLIAGAAAATGTVLWFLHADSTPEREAGRYIRHHLDSGNDGGFFQFRFTGLRSLSRRLLEKSINWRARIGVPYGDQGLFVRRAAYEAVGGFAPTPLFEEPRLVKRLRKAYAFTPADYSIGVSPRRWERDGWIRRTLHNRWLAVRYMMGAAPEKLAGQYRPVPDATHPAQPQPRVEPKLESAAEPEVEPRAKGRVEPTLEDLGAALKPATQESPGRNIPDATAGATTREQDDLFPKA